MNTSEKPRVVAIKLTDKAMKGLVGGYTVAGPGPTPPIPAVPG